MMVCVGGGVVGGGGWGGGGGGIGLVIFISGCSFQFGRDSSMQYITITVQSLGH